jgi:UDP-3-O-acyl-N-acetylglucosamine deacetylase
MENLMTYLTSLMSLLPLVGAAFKGLAAIHKKTEEDKTKTTIKENTKRNASNLATAATAAFKSAVETFGWPGIIVGAALAAAIIAGGIFALTAGAPKQTQGEKKE